MTYVAERTSGCLRVKGIGGPRDPICCCAHCETQRHANFVGRSRFSWGDVFNRHLAKGEDHASAAYAADEAEKRAKRTT